MILNNLMSAKSVSTNCEPDNCVALLNDVHDLIANHISSSEAVSEKTDEYVDVVFAPEFNERELNFFESESLVQAGNLIRAKILERCYCNDCERNLQIDSASSNFIEVFVKVFNFALQSIPYVASEKCLQKFIVEEVRKKFKEEEDTNDIDELNVIGCVEHNPEIVNKLYQFTTVYAINIFCKNINGFLSGKTNELPPEANDIQILAHTFRTKKRIKKHSDIFNT